MKRSLLLTFGLGLGLTAVALGVFLIHTSAAVSRASLPAPSTDTPVTNFVEVSAGNGHTCGLTVQGGVMCWGANNTGQLGDGTSTDRYTPVYVSGLATGVATVSAGSTHTCALLTMGGVKCWGNNNRGQLGDGTKIDRRLPIDVVGLTNGVASIEAGGLDTCAITVNGGAKCWGSNHRGRLGDGTTIDRWTPVDVVGLSSGVIAIRTNDAGGAHTCAVLAGGGVKCWGSNESGQLGDGSGADQHTPVDVSGLTSGVIDAALGTWHTCAVIAAGGVKCWGNNISGQLGDGTTIDRPTPVEVSAPIGTAARIAAGNSHSCALLNDGGIQCWGYNFSGELGDGTTINRPIPVNVIGLAGDALTLSAGGAHTCASIGSGQAMCWGENYAGQLGNGQAINFTTPTANPSLTSGVTSVGLGSYHACALAVGGGVQCWGDNGFGQLGAGSIVTQTPVSVSGMSSGVTALTAGSLHSCAVADGGLRCWGDNRAGQLGDGTTIRRTVPITVTGLISGVAGVSAGWLHTCALTDSGGVQCWGEGVTGGCATSSSPIPVDVCGLTEGVTAVSSGDRHACALLATGGIKCWGNNIAGQLGDGTTTEQPTPVDVLGLPLGAKALGAGLVHTCAILLDDSVRCWGNNAYGQLGDGAVSGVQAISAGDGHNCAITTGGGLRCWGYNYYGQLGDGTLNNSATPRQVSGLTSGVTAIDAGYEHTCAVADGALWCWGNNEYGLVNPDRSAHSAVPVTVLNPVWRVYMPLTLHNYQPLHASFTANPMEGLAPLNVIFTNTSSGSNFTSTWDYGDGITRVQPNPSHVYGDAGIYTATLTISDGAASSATSATIKVLPAQERLINGDFEQGLWAWQWSDYPDHANVVTDVVHSGKYAARLGIEPPDELHYSNASAIYSIGILPGTPHARLSFWYWPRREGVSGNPQRSRQFAYLLEGETILKKLFEFDENLSNWQYIEVDLTPYQGRSLALQFGVYHDGSAVYGKRSWLYVDDVSLLFDAEPFPTYQLVAYYPFNGDAYDASGNGNPGAVHGATLTANRFGNLQRAYQFDGTADYIGVGYNSSLSFSQDLTAAAWIKTTDDAGGIAQQQNGGADGNFVFGVSQDGRFRFGRSDNVASGKHDSQVVNDGQWHLLVGVFDHVQGVVKHYIDGRLVLTYTDTAGLPDNHIPIIIGDDNNHLNAFGGIIDDVRLYCRALSDQEIMALWEAER